MRTQISDTLVVDTWPAYDPGDEDMIRIVDLAQQRDSGSACIIVVYPDEVKALISALVDAAVDLAGERASGSSRSQPAGDTEHSHSVPGGTFDFWTSTTGTGGITWPK